jgi:DNA (cytosine-5)-methyltransferase 1
MDALVGFLTTKKIRFIDLFAGIGGIRLGFEQAAKALGLETECVLTSEIKAPAIATYQQNFPQEFIQGDITKISVQDIPDFDYLLAGFPCQPFSNAGQRLGFLDTRGTLFFEIERILETKKPMGFLLENVEGLVAHDQGRTLKTILVVLEKLGYQVTWKVLNALDFGVPQERKRIFILGHLHQAISLEFEALPLTRLGDLLEKNLPILDSAFTRKIFTHYKPEDLYGKSIKDKRGGADNIHSWDLELKGDVSVTQKRLLETVSKNQIRNCPTITSRFENAKTSFPSRADTGVCPYKTIKMRQVGANPRVRPVTSGIFLDCCIN